MFKRIESTAKANELIAQLKERNGDLLFIKVVVVVMVLNLCVLL